jgi:transposase
MLRRARQHPLPLPALPEPLALLSLPDLTPERWEPLRAFLPPQASRGRPAGEHRLIVEGILWIMRTGSSWRDLPARFGPWQTIASRYRQWRKEGRWQLMLQVLQQPEAPLLSSA